MKQTAYEYLIQDRLTNIDMLEILLLEDAKVVYAGADGVVLLHDGLYLLSCDAGKDESFLPILTRDLRDGDERMIVLHSDALIETLRRRFGYHSVMDYYHAIYPLQEPIPYTLPEGAEIRRLDQNHVTFVHEHYHTFGDVGYIRERIEDCMFGVFVNGAPAGFVGTHDERSIGMLEVLPEYRRMGLAYALEAHIVNYLLSLGRVPFTQVSIKNDASILLQKKLGFTVSSSVIHWLARSPQ